MRSYEYDPPEGHLDSMRTLSWFVSSYRRLSPPFQFSLSAVTLGIYLGGLSVVAYSVRVTGAPRECESLWEYTTTYSQIKANVLPVSVGGFTHTQREEKPENWCEYNYMILIFSSVTFAQF